MMLLIRHPVALFLIVVLALLGALRSFSTPAPVDAGAPDVVFSAYRAEAILRDLLQESIPHVAGSPQNAVVRDRVLAHLEAAGYRPEVQSLFHCSPRYGACSPVDNIIAVKGGAVGKHAVLLTAHYDSAAAGPGAADDGSGVAAILEIARMAAEFPAFNNDVIFLISDSEENGLIGADAFATSHPLFARVKAVINLEARGVTGPSVMFETGEGNRSVIRMLEKNVPRPVANSLAYEIYRRMPNDTDFTVFRERGLTGVNFAFARGVALYHSMLDDPDHLDLGSLQHQGDNAWGMLNAFGERDLSTIYHAEDAGFIDLFGARLVHYPVSIAGGLALFLGVWVMIAIGLAFRKEFRYRQLRWGLLAIPLALAAVALGGYLLSWPLGRWPDLHPLEHPYPWPGRVTLFLMLGLVIYATLKLFSGRVSACAWMILGWASVFALGLVLAARLPAATHIALLPLAMFAVGSVIDLFRKKSPAPLLMASVLGFAMAAYLSMYHFLMLEVATNFDRSYVVVAPLVLLFVTAMPMLLAFVRKRKLTWRPAAWLLAAVVAGCVVQLFVPGFTEERPRDMSLMYSESGDGDRGYLVLESTQNDYDHGYARDHGFEPAELNNGRLGTVERPVREVAALGLPGVAVTDQQVRPEAGGWRHSLLLELPPPRRILRFAVPREAGLRKAWVNGELAFDASLPTKRPRQSFAVTVVNPGEEPLRVELLTDAAEGFLASAVTWHDLPAQLTAPYAADWPDDARPAFYGPRAEKIQSIPVMPGR